MYRKPFDWDDARLFLAIAREGSLRAAARVLDISQPTVGRRLARFEASLGDTPLFDRLPEGMRLTGAGQAVLPLAEQLEATAAVLQGRRVLDAAQVAAVRVSVGEWSGNFLAGCLSGAGRSALPAGLAVELVGSDQTANLTRREADLAVRHGRPETGNLFVTGVGTIACAAYRAPGGAGGWISYSEDQAHYVQSRWIEARAQADGTGVTTRATSMGMQVIAARAGAGTAVLPCYLGDRDPALVRVTDRIGALDAPHWIIVHRDLRRLPVVRAVTRWLAQTFAANLGVLEGASNSTGRT